MPDWCLTAVGLPLLLVVLVVVMLFASAFPLVVAVAWLGAPLAAWALCWEPVWKALAIHRIRSLRTILVVVAAFGGLGSLVFVLQAKGAITRWASGWLWDWVLGESPDGEPGAVILVRDLSLFGLPALTWWGATRAVKASAVLHDAARDGNLDRVSFWLDRGVSVHGKDEQGLTPLHVAAASRGKEDDSTAVVEALLAAGADVNAADAGGRTPLHLSAENRLTECWELLLANGADADATDQEGLTPLHLAAAWGGRRLPELLVKHGADVRARDERGATPLHYAATSPRAESAAVLLRNGADVNARDAGMLTPLHYAAHNLRTEVARLLLQHGADVNAKNCLGSSALDLAKSWEGGTDDFEKLLAAFGAASTD